MIILPSSSCFSGVPVAWPQDFFQVRDNLGVKMVSSPNQKESYLLHPGTKILLICSKYIDYIVFFLEAFGHAKTIKHQPKMHSFWTVLEHCRVSKTVRIWTKKRPSQEERIVWLSSKHHASGQGKLFQSGLPFQEVQDCKFHCPSSSGNTSMPCVRWDQSYLFKIKFQQASCGPAVDGRTPQQPPGMFLNTL